MKLTVKSTHRLTHGLEIVTIEKIGDVLEYGHRWKATFEDGSCTWLLGCDIKVSA
ncbi:hypothetical protein NWP13_23815 [Rhodococcus pyridinivorans]|nr:hypothetical protein [Rhodococcus pyridinivorans]